jgi:hypothetical protein
MEFKSRCIVKEAELWGVTPWVTLCVEFELWERANMGICNNMVQNAERQQILISVN